MRPHRITYPALLLSALIASSTMAYGADERIDTLSSSKVSSSYGSIVVPQRIAGKELKASANISEAVRRFAGVQVRDYGGVGGLKTVNVRSLGSEHTGVFIDGIQVDNAQNMQVDLGRFSTDNLRSVSLFNGQKASFLQSAREYSSASSVYLETARPEFGRRKWNRRVWIRGGSFGTFSPGLTLERLFRGGASLRLTGEAVSSDGRYRFHVSDFRHTPEGTMAGYDTVMTRRNCDLRSVRAEAQLFSGKGSESDWLLHAYYYDSERGLPGPVFKRAGGYPLSEDRQADRNMFAQGRWSDRLGARLTVSARFKYAFDKLEYLDFPELRPEANPADFTYRNHTAYVSAAALADILDWWKVNVAADVQYGHLSANLRDFSSPDRTTVYTSLTNVFSLGSLEAYATLLYLNARDSFRNPGSGRGKASRDAFMPSVVARLRLSDGLSVNGMTFSMQDRTGGDVNKFYDITQKFIGELNKRPEISNAMTSYNTKYPQYKIDVDVAKCKQSGIDPSTVLTTMQGYYGGMYASNFNSYGKLYRVYIQSEPKDRADLKSLANIYVRTQTGQMAPIQEYVNLERVYGPQEIDRFNLFTSINVNASAADGYSTGDAIKAMDEVAKTTLPAGYTYEFSGLTRTEQESALP